MLKFGFRKRKRCNMKKLKENKVSVKQFRVNNEEKAIFDFLRVEKLYDNDSEIFRAALILLHNESIKSAYKKSEYRHVLSFDEFARKHLYDIKESYECKIKKGDK